MAEEPDEAEPSDDTGPFQTSSTLDAAADNACSQTNSPLDAAADNAAPAPRVLFNAAHCEYEVVTKAAKSRGWRVIRGEKKAAQCQVHWIDDNGVRDWMPKIESGMRVNHFPGMFDALGRKSCLARNMARAQRRFPSDFRFLPKSWVLPHELEDLERHFRSGARDVFIVKPDNMSKGKGIFLTNELEKIKAAMGGSRSDLPTVVQLYIAKPLLIEGLKFDLRLYVLVCGFVLPSGLQLRSFLFSDGLVRFCTLPYEAPTSGTMNQRRMHLTNYSINRRSCDFDSNEDADDGSKRSLLWFMTFISEEFGEHERKKLWSKLTGLCAKMVAAVEPVLVAEYASAFPKDALNQGSQGAECRCFQVLGVDVMLDQKRKPFLIEVNTLPSFETDSALDEDIKERVVQQSLDLTCASLSSPGLDFSAPIMQPLAGAAEVAADASRAPSAGSLLRPHPLLDSETHGDFERIFPPREQQPKLAQQCEAILAHARSSFHSLHVSLERRRRLFAKSLWG